MLTVTLDYPDTQVATLPQTDVKTIASGAPFKYLLWSGARWRGKSVFGGGSPGDGRVFKTAPDGTVSVAAQIPAANSPYLTDIVIDGAGNFWLGNASGGIVWKIDTQGGFTKTVVSSLDSIAGIALDAQGSLLLTGQRPANTVW